MDECLRSLSAKSFLPSKKQNKKKALIQTIKFHVVLEFYGLKKPYLQGKGSRNF